MRCTELFSRNGGGQNEQCEKEAGHKGAHMVHPPTGIYGRVEWKTKKPRQEEAPK